MKWMIASDIHGSAYYCAKLKEAYEREKPGRLLLIGDVLYHGPRNDLPRDYDPKKVIEILNSISKEIICVRGNCDSEVDQMVLDFPLMSDSMALVIEDRFFFVTHGHIFKEADLHFLHEGDILLSGHTHVPAKEKRGDHWYINPGSVSIPKNDSPHSYMTAENGSLYWKTLDGEIYDEFSL